MLLAGNCMLIAPQKDAFVGIISCQLWQKVIVQKTKWSCLPPVCLSFFSRLKVFMSRFFGGENSEKTEQFLSDALHWRGGDVGGDCRSTPLGKGGCLLSKDV